MYNSLDSKKRKMEEKMHIKNSLVILLICLAMILFCLSGCDPDDDRFNVLPNEYPKDLLEDDVEKDVSINTGFDDPFQFIDECPAGIDRIRAISSFAAFTCASYSDV